MIVDEMFWARWMNRSNEYQRLKIMADAAKLIEELLDDVRSCMRMSTDVRLTLREAASKTGYSTEHLARMIREGRIPNGGRRGAPRIRVGDLPPRREFAGKRSRSYDVDTDARTLRNGRQ